MALYGLLQKKEVNSEKVTNDDIEQFCQGNICRCTGYRPIYTAARTVAGIFNRSQQQQGRKRTIRRHRPSSPVESTKTDDGERKLLLRTSRVATSTPLYIRPTSLTSLFDTLKTLGPASASSPLRLVVGNTSKGVVKYYSPQPSDNPTTFVDIGRLKELRQITSTKDDVTFGAAVTLSTIIDSLGAIIAAATNEEDSRYDGIRAAVRHLKLVAHPQVRDVASWCGNVCLAKAHPNFPSDVVVVLTAVDAAITLLDGSTSPATATTMSVPEFLKTSLTAQQIVSAVTVPFLPETTPTSRVYVDTFKVMLRHCNSHALVNAGFRATVSAPAQSDGAYTLTDASFVFGNITQGPFLCPKTTKLIRDQQSVMSMDTLGTLCASLRGECVCAPCPVDDPNFLVEDPTYRRDVAVSLFFKFYLSVLHQCSPGLVPSNLVSAFTRFERPISSGTETYDRPSSNEDAPIHDPVHKIDALKQTAGEISYTSDQTLPSGTLFGVPLLADRSGAVVKSIDTSDAMKMPGVVRFVSAVDLSSIGATNAIGNYTIFADSSTAVKHVGQICGVLLGSNGFDETRRAVRTIRIEYGDTRSPKESTKVSDAPDFHVFVPRDTPSTSSSSSSSSLSDAHVTYSGAISTTGQKHLYVPRAVIIHVVRSISVVLCIDLPSSCFSYDVSSPPDSILNLPLLTPQR